MRRIVIALLASTALATYPALAQGNFFAPETPQPLGPDWQKIPGGMGYNGCITAPIDLPGGCMGNGTVNFGAYYLNGVELFGPDTGPVLQIPNGGTGGTTPLLGRGNLGVKYFSVSDYGGICDGQASHGAVDTAAINNMLADIRALPNNTIKPIIVFPGNPLFNFNSPTSGFKGSACYIVSSVNATSASNGADALSSQNKLLILGGRLECHTTGTPCLDMSGSTWFHFVGTVINSPSGPDESSYGLQIARIHLLQGAGAHTFENITVQGFYTRAAVMDFASEENVWINPQISNNDTLNVTSNYTFIDDGCNHFGVKSQFQNIDIPVSSPVSYVQQTFLGGSITSGSNQPNMIAPLFTCATLNHQFKNMYIHTANQGYAVHYFGIAQGNSMQAKFDLHVEGAPIATFLFENNSSPTQTYVGFSFKDHSTNTTGSIIATRGAHAPMTTITIHNFDIDIGRMGQGAGIQLFDNYSAFSIDGGTVRLPSISNWQPPTNVNWINGSYTSETICLQDQTPACETQGQVPVINRNPDFLIDQAFEGAVETPSNGGIVVDGWREEDSQTFSGPMTFNQGTNLIPSRPFVSWYSLQGTVANQKTPVAGDYYDIYTTIDGGDMSSLRWGWGAQAQSTVLTYCAQSNVAGITLPIYLASANPANAGSQHYYNIDDTIATANTWSCFTHLIRGDQTGTTIWSGVTNQASLRIGITFADMASDPSCVDGVWQSIVCRSTRASGQFINQPNGTAITLSYFHFYKGFSQRQPIVESYSVQLMRAQRWYRKSMKVGYAPGITLPGQPGSIMFISPYASTTSGRAGTRVDWPTMFTNRTASLPHVFFYSPMVLSSSKCYNFSQSRESGAATALAVSENGFMLQCALVAGDAVSDLIGVQYVSDSGY